MRRSIISGLETAYRSGFGQVHARFAAQRRFKLPQRVYSEPRDLAPAGSPTPEMVAGSLNSSYSQTFLQYPNCKGRVNLHTHGKPRTPALQIEIFIDHSRLAPPRNDPPHPPPQNKKSPPVPIWAAIPAKQSSLTVIDVPIPAF